MHNTTELKSPWPPCPLCDERHDEVLALLATEPQAGLRRISTADLLDQREYLSREMAESKADPEYAAGLTTLHRHRLQIIEGELERRRRLEAFGGPTALNSGRITMEIVAELKRRISIVDLITEDLGEPAHMGLDRSLFHCSLHGDGVDRHASLTAYETEQRFWCFGCNQGGDIFDWLLIARGQEWRPSVEFLARRCGIELPAKVAPAPRRREVARV